MKDETDKGAKDLKAASEIPLPAGLEEAALQWISFFFCSLSCFSPKLIGRKRLKLGCSVIYGTDEGIHSAEDVVRRSQVDEWLMREVSGDYKFLKG
ncbi:hypothetical protein AVEN_16531-1 [Araneus ventricosus]|uniref:Uncharacterized protein n=1 Tax=Araneus ventricosus TaxID=182803 RepID=A0A4Y2NB66_ARAVE|nr:hypothetical protein AVEN_16531-1 [Araneus ventricosus]